MKHIKTFESFLKENVSNGAVTCSGCGWRWDLSVGGKDPYICHKCWRDNDPLVNEAASYKQKSDFSGKKWGAQLMGDRVYQFKSGGHDYVLDFVIDEYISNTEYILRSDIRTKGKEFELVKSGSPFELISTVKEIHSDVLQDLKANGYTVKGLKLYYSREPDETKNTRATIFNRAVVSALAELGIKYNVTDHIDTRLNKHIYEYQFR
jgi:hypothetical protein